MADTFDPDAYLAKYGNQQSAFNPDAYLAKYGNQEGGLHSFGRYLGEAGRAFADNVGNKFTGGYLSNIQAGLGQGIDSILPKSMQSGLSYDQMRDLEDAKQKEEAMNTPEAATAGKIGGIGLQMYGLSKLGSLLAPAAESTMAESTIAKSSPGIIKRGLVGAVKGTVGAGLLGGSENPGNTPGETNPIQLDARLQNAKNAAPYGFGLGALAGAVGGDTAKNIGTSMKSAAEIPAVKAAGPFMRDLNEISGNDPYQLESALRSRGRTALDQGVVGGFPKSPSNLAKKAYDATQSVGEKFGDYLDTISGALKEKAASSVEGEGPVPQLGVDMDKVGDTVREKLTIPNPRTAAAKAHNEAVSDLISDLTSKNQPKILDVDAAQDLKESEIDKLANWNKPRTLDPTPEELRFRAVSSALKDGIADSANDAIDYLEKKGALPEGFSKADFLKTKKDYGNMKDFGGMTMKQLKKSISNRSSSLTANMAGDAAGVAGAMVSGGNPLITGGSAAIGNLGTKMAGRYGNQIQAGLLNSVGGLLQKTPNLSTGLIGPVIGNELRKR